MASIADGGLNKANVKRHFDRRAAGYDEHTALQRAAADWLMEALVGGPSGARSREASAGKTLAGEAPFAAPRRIYEIGCGTGYLTARLRERFPGAAIIACDFAPGMIALARARVGDGVSWVCDDCERYFPTEPVDLIVSNATLQWLAEPECTLAQLQRCLVPGGRLVAGLFGAGTLNELRIAFAMAETALGLPPRPHGPQLREAAWWRETLAAAGFASTCDHQLIVKQYPSVDALLRVVREMGAAHAGRADQVRVHPTLIRRMRESYATRFGDGGGVRAGFDVLRLVGTPAASSEKLPG